MDDETLRAGEPQDRWDDWREAQNTVGAHPGSAVGWLGLMVLLLGGLALMGAAFTDGNGLLFAAGIAVAGIAFAIPLELAGRRER